MIDELKDFPANALRDQRRSDKFAPKLDRDDRCRILALYRGGMKRDIVGRVFQINKRTVSHICNPASRHYKSIRDEEKAMGFDAFRSKYLTPEVMENVRKAVVEMNLDKVAPHVSARANRHEGRRMVHPPQCAYEHDVEIRYLDNADPPGWYYKDHTSKDDSWLHNGTDSLATSQACFDAMKLNLMDELL